MGEVIDMDQVRAEIRAAVEKRQAECDAPPGGKDDGPTDDSKFIRQCLHANQLGDAAIYKRANAGKFVFNKAMGRWMTWTGHHWAVDMMDAALASMEAVVDVYAGELRAVNEQIVKAMQEGGEESKLVQAKALRKELERRIYQLRGTSRRDQVLTMAHTSADPLAIRGDEIDAQPWLLACANGVIDLRSGEMRSGRREDWLVKASPIEWRGIDEPCLLWRQTIHDVLSGRDDLVRFIQRALGYALIGQVREAAIFVFTGQGRNGKSMIVDVVSHVMGGFAAPIRAEMLLDQGRLQSSAGPSPDIMALRGLRLAFGSETDDGCRISPSRVKWLTGNDQLKARAPMDKFEINFYPSHTLFLLTNHKPHAPADDFAFWERMCLVPFELSFVTREPRADNERQADPDLPNKLKQEASGILAWLVQGCLEYQLQGLNPPPVVVEATSEYRRDEDIIADFLDECTLQGEFYRVGATKLYQAFEQWWQTNVSKSAPKQKRFGTMMSKRFKREKEGQYSYLGLKLLDDLDDAIMERSNGPNQSNIWKD